VEGPAGTGKSALLASAGDRAHAAGLRVLRARGAEFEADLGFGLVRQLFEAEARTAPKPARQVLTAAPSVRHGVADEFSTLHAIYWLTMDLATESSLVLVVDDAHWADASSLRALSYLSRRIANSPVILLIAARTHEPGAPEELLDELRSLPETVRLMPPPLSAEAVASLVRGRLPDADPEVCQAFADATAGNPFLLRELVLAATANGALSGPDPARVVRESAVLSVGDRVVRRIARVGDQAPGLAAAMATLGPNGSLEMASALAGIDADEGARIAHQLRRFEVLAEEDPFTFAHPLVRRSIYDALPTAESRSLHAAAADLLREAGASMEAVASQLRALPPSGSSAVAGTLLGAAREAQARAAPSEAAGWFRRALAERAEEPSRAVLLEGLGMTQAALRDTAAIATLQEAAGVAEDPAQKARVTAGLAEILASAGQWQSCVDVITEARADLASADPDLQATVEAVAVAVKVYDPAYASDIEDELDRIEELAAGSGWGSLALAGLLAVRAAHRGESVPRIRALAQRALHGGRLFAEHGAGSWASIHPLGTLIEIEDHEPALAACDELAAAAREQGWVSGRVASLALRGMSHVRRGRLAIGEAEIRTGLDMADRAKVPMAATSAAFFLVDALLERPGHEDLAAFIESVELDPTFANTWSGAHLRHVRGRLRLAALDRDGAVEDLRASYAIQAALGWGPTAAPTRSVLALALPASEREEAVTLAAEELDLARAAGLARGEGVALRAVGLLTGGDNGIEQLRESVSLLTSVEAPLEQARSRVELGAALRRSRHNSDARAELEAGLELAGECGALRLITRAQEELSAAGGRRAPVAASGLESLTPSERRVADLAARGASNAEIAQELFVVEKTVEAHLSSAYAKLGLSGRGARRRLAEALSQQR
jgi:DNA-binding CsgD family transcriptional regulator